MTPRYSAAPPDRSGSREPGRVPPKPAAVRRWRSAVPRFPTRRAAPRRQGSAAGPESMRSAASAFALGRLVLSRLVHQPLDADHVILVAAIEQERGAVARPRQLDR